MSNRPTSPTCEIAARTIGALHCNDNVTPYAEFLIPSWRRDSAVERTARALLRRFEGMTGVAIEASELEEAAERFDEQIDRAVAANPEIEELVSRIEAEQVDLLTAEGEDLPSADTIAREFQRFLRQRGKES